MMKKILLTAIMAAFLSSFANAYELNENVYTQDGKYKILSGNLLTNGDFSNGLEGWTTAAGTALSTDTFMVDPTGGPAGKAALLVQITGAASTGGHLHLSVPRSAGKYYLVTYKAMNPSGTATSSILNGGSNYQLAYVDSIADANTALSGANFAKISKAYAYTDQWTTVNFAYTSLVDGFISLDMYNLNVGDMFADFAVYEANEIADDRDLKAVVDEALLYANSDFFSNAEAKNALKETAETVWGDYQTVEDKDEMNGVIEALKGEDGIDGFLAANTVNVSSYLNDADFENATVTNSRGNGTITGWTAESGRWAGHAADGWFSSKYAQAWIGYNGTSYSVAGSLKQSVNLPAGKYMFSIESCVARYMDKNSNINTLADIENMYIFVNGDTAMCETTSCEKPITYRVFATVPEGEKVNVGIVLASQANLWGVDNAVLRKIDGNQEEIDAYVYAANLAEAKATLKTKTEAAVVLKDDATYFYGKVELQDSITLANTIYDSSTVIEEVTTMTSNLQTAMNAYIALNAEYITLCKDFEEGNALMASGEYKHGLEELQAQLDIIEETLAALDANTPDPTGLTAAHEQYTTTLSTFYFANASYTTPGVIGIVNPNFKDGFTGWVKDTDTGNGKWKTGASGSFVNGYNAYYWRGSTAFTAHTLYQEVKIEISGLYEYCANAYCNNESSKYNKPETNIWFYMGTVKDATEHRIDSIQAYTDPANGTTPAEFRVRAILNAGDTLRFGWDGSKNACANRGGFGDNQILYYGPYDEYLKDSIAAVIKPAKDSLQSAIDAAQALFDEALNKDKADTTPFTSAIASAQTAQAGDDLSAIQNAFASLDAATKAFMLSGVSPAKDKYYDVSYAIVNNDFVTLDSLQGWTIAGDTASTISGGGVTYYYSADNGEVNQQMSQVVNNLPAGYYQLLSNATYRIGLPETFIFDVYDTTHPMNLFANENTVAVKGLLEGQTDSTYVVDVMGLTVYDYRHTNFGIPMSNGFCLQTLDFKLDNKSDVSLGFTVTGNIGKHFSFRVNDMQLRYFGNQNPDGINAMEMMPVADGAVYNMMGQRVRSNGTLNGLPKGIYLFNGKKVLVK